MRRGGLQGLMFARGRTGSCNTLHISLREDRTTTLHCVCRGKSRGGKCC